MLRAQQGHHTVFGSDSKAAVSKALALPVLKVKVLASDPLF